MKDSTVIMTASFVNKLYHEMYCTEFWEAIMTILFFIIFVRFITKAEFLTPGYHRMSRCSRVPGKNIGPRASKFVRVDCAADIFARIPGA